MHARRRLIRIFLLVSVLFVVSACSMKVTNPVVYISESFIYTPEDGVFPHSDGELWGKVTGMSKEDEALKMVIEQNVLKVSAGVQSTLYWIIHEGSPGWENVDFSRTPVTIDLSLRIVEHGARDEGGDEIAFQIYFEDGNSEAYIRFNEDGVTSSNSRQLYSMDTTEWHDYRLEIVENTVTLYVDNDASPKYSWTMGSSSREGRIHFGDTSGAWGGKYELRSLKHTIHYPSDN